MKTCHIYLHIYFQFLTYSINLYLSPILCHTLTPWYMKFYKTPNNQLIKINNSPLKKVEEQNPKLYQSPSNSYLINLNPHSFLQPSPFCLIERRRNILSFPHQIPQCLGYYKGGVRSVFPLFTYHQPQSGACYLLLLTTFPIYQQQREIDLTSVNFIAFSIGF